MKVFEYKWFVAIMALVLCGSLSCHRGAPEDKTCSTTDEMHLPGVVRTPMEGFEFICIQDKPGAHPAHIFQGGADSILQQLLPNGEAESSVNVFLLANDERNVLVDAGLGAANGGALQERLKGLHVRPEEVSVVLLTHFHPDHIGGLMLNGEAAFPKAEVYASVEEYEAWVNGALRGKNQLVLTMLSNYAPRLHLFMDGDTLLGHIVAHLAPGHTPGHTVFEVGDVLITGDLIHAKALQVPHPEFSSKYDEYPPLAAQTRAYWLQYAQEHHKVFAGMHLPLPGTL